MDNINVMATIVSVVYIYLCSKIVQLMLQVHRIATSGNNFTMITKKFTLKQLLLMVT